MSVPRRASASTAPSPVDWQQTPAESSSAIPTAESYTRRPSFRRVNTAGAISRRPSTALTPVATGLSVKDLYGDIPEDLIQLERLKTYETVLTLYPDLTKDEGELSTPADGSSLLAVDPELVTWEGADDPANPRNWPRAKKWRATIAVSLYTFLGPFSSSILSPALSSIALQFNITNTTLASLIVSIFVLAWAIMPLVLAPLSELYGRRIVLTVAIFFLFVFNLACALSQSLSQILIFRFLAGCGGAGPLAIGAGCVADIWNDNERTAAIGLFSVGPTLGPIVAPVISGFISQYLSWRWVFWILTIVTGVVWMIGLIMIKETYAPILLERKAAILRKESGNRSLHTVFAITGESLSDRILTSITRPITMLFTNPIVFGLGLYMAFTYGFLYLLLVTFTSVFRTEYHYSISICGLLYIGPGIGFIIGLLTVTPTSQRIYRKLVERNNNVSKPEFRLPAVAIGAVCMPIGLIWYGWSAEKKLFWIMPLIGAGLFGIALISVFQCIQSYLIDMNPKYAASSTAAATTFRSLFGFAMPLFASQMYTAMGYGWGNTMLAFCAIGIGTVFPLVVYYKGESIRAWNDKRMDERKERHDARKKAKLRRKLDKETNEQEKKILRENGEAAIELRRLDSTAHPELVDPFRRPDTASHSVIPEESSEDSVSITKSVGDTPRSSSDTLN
ncbi:major facilitator superfamily domain-containing protein [Lipomyces oligophaga]|uniref:major facilitator superfamily domain-containing protein n=1 Tax=Lipomyces oligophaga TaxID=45792 RepID=UPI0034CE8013